jgi:hypothetical protein
MPLPSDIIAKIERDFPKAEVASVIDLVSELPAEDPNTFTDRVLRCVISLSRGNYSDLTRNVASARTDWRDLMYWSEYDANDVRVRDHSIPFKSDV